MPDGQAKKPKAKRLRLMVELSFAADDAIHEIRRRHRRETGRDLPKWKVIGRGCGLIDLHSHLARDVLRLLLTKGVLADQSIRDRIIWVEPNRSIGRHPELP